MSESPPSERPDRRSERAIAAIAADLAARGSVLVAYSGGVDSAVVAALAVRALGERALAVTAAAETMAGAELDHARRLAAEIGIRHRVVTYSELDEPRFVANPSYRCYVCQGMRMDSMWRVAAEEGGAFVCDGTNASDPGPDRPGLAAVRERGVYSPLLAHGVDKAATRAIARALGLSAWDRPANACLSSRIPHGQVVTLGKLRRVEAAEELLAGEGFRVVRVRHDGGAARVEVGTDEVARLAARWSDIHPRLLALGFRRSGFDPQGYRSGGADRAGASRDAPGSEATSIGAAGHDAATHSAAGPAATGHAAAGHAAVGRRAPRGVPGDEPGGDRQPAELAAAWR